MVLQLYELRLWIFIYLCLIFPVLQCPFGLDYTSISAATDALSMLLEVEWDLFTTEEDVADKTSKREEMKTANERWHSCTFLSCKTSKHANVKTAWLSFHSFGKSR